MSRSFISVLDVRNGTDLDCPGRSASKAFRDSVMGLSPQSECFGIRPNGV